MLTSAARRAHRSFLPTAAVRSLSTEPATPSTTADILPPTKHPAQPPKPRSRLYPHPRPAVSHKHQSLPTLPPSFGRNQFLPVSTSTRALLESIVAQFNAPIRYAFAYGSGVFEQDGYTAQNAGSAAPMLDFLFAVTHSGHWHSINMQQHASHYPLHARALGSSYIARIEEIIPGVWFNAYIPIKGVVCVTSCWSVCGTDLHFCSKTIKYGVTTVDNLCSDLLNWRTLYLAGRMHKPLRIIKDDARVRLTQQVNLTSAVRAALLTLPPDFTEIELFERIAGISYSGDPRMLLPAENRGKVGNIVRKQAPQFKELYHRLVVGLPGVHWPAESSNIQQDATAQARSAHLRKLPSNLLARVKDHYASLGFPPLDADESAYWVRLGSNDQLPFVLRRGE
jgi:translocator assembly and maintenance protein 41